MTSRVGAIVLAAGFSHRFGSLKLCAELDNGATVFSQTLERVRSALPDYKVITRPEIADLLRPIEADLHVFADAEQGMGSTLAHAIGLIEDWDACLVCLADMPFIQAETYSRLAAELSSDNIVIPFHQQKAGNPVGFGSKFFAELGQLDGDSGGKSIVQANKASIIEVDIAEPAILYDIDTPEDLARYQSQSS